MTLLLYVERFVEVRVQETEPGTSEETGAVMMLDSPASYYLLVIWES